ncbi:MAG: EthD family reductase [Gammaproteobacteria bacterium]|nr:EthD family reductase [Gammaproteobacteria bacterium]
MLKQVTIFKKRPDLATDAFEEHWRTRHAEIVCELPGLRRYVQNHMAPDAGDHVDGIAEVWFDDIDAMRANAGHPALEAIRADERNFIDVDTMVAIIAEPAIVIDGEAGDAKLIVLVKRNPSVEPERFHRAWRDEVGGAMAALASAPHAPTRYEQDHTRAGGYRHGREPAFDGTASLWFPNQDAAGAFFTSPGFATVAAAERDLMDPAGIKALWVEPVIVR